MLLMVYRLTTKKLYILRWIVVSITSWSSSSLILHQFGQFTRNVRQSNVLKHVIHDKISWLIIHFLMCTLQWYHCISKESFTLSDGEVQPIGSVCNLSAFFNFDMNMKMHINRLVSSCYYQLWSIWSIRRSLPIMILIKLINSFVAFRNERFENFSLVSWEKQRKRQSAEWVQPRDWGVIKVTKVQSYVWNHNITLDCMRCSILSQ